MQVVKKETMNLKEQRGVSRRIQREEGEWRNDGII